jgi:hypothetical protein
MYEEAEQRRCTKNAKGVRKRVNHKEMMMVPAGIAEAFLL